MRRVITCLLVGTTWANNLRIQNVTWDKPNRRVSFELSWNNAWRLTTPPANWDAAWIFIKFRACNDLNAAWTHGQVSTTLADHTLPPALEFVRSDGTAGIDNNQGVLVRPSTAGIYPNFGPHSITLRVNNLPTTGDYDLKVFGIEMVFIPQGSYLLGSLSGPGQYTFDNDPNTQTGDPINITSENSLTVRWRSGGGSGSQSVPLDFPKGFRAFHVMKYEISEGQYADFLNTLPSTVASTRYLGNYNFNRNRLNQGGSYPNVYFSERPDRAQNWMSWADLTAYLDWACLRPITEMEYEKICRGPGPSVDNEYAWGTTTITAGTTFNISPENGTEEFVNAGANCTYNNVVYTGGDGESGPVRVGIHAKPNSPSRQASGAAYYGVFDMSGNVWEMVIMVSSASCSGADAFTGSWGNGDGVPPASWGGDDHFGLRGGAWNSSGWGGGPLRVSDKSQCYPGWRTGWWGDNITQTTRGAAYGGRGAR